METHLDTTAEGRPSRPASRKVRRAARVAATGLTVAIGGPERSYFWSFADVSRNDTICLPPREVPRQPTVMKRALLALLGFAATGCALIRPPTETSPLVGLSLLEPSVCSALAPGSTLWRSFSPPAEPPQGMAFTGTFCAEPAQSAGAGYPTERRSRWIEFPTDTGTARGLVTAPSSKPRGVQVLFAPFGQTPEDPLMQELAVRLAEAGYVVVRVLREESYGTLLLDPVAEARRGAALGGHVRAVCKIEASVRFGGASLGGAEALIAARVEPQSPVVVIDPLVDIEATVAWLESWSPSLSRVAMKQYFRGIVAQRFGSGRTSLVGALREARTGSTSLARDMPAHWLEEMNADWWAHVHVFLSRRDYALGSAGRDVFQRHHGSVTVLPVDGHVALFCLRGGLAQVVDRMAGSLDATRASR